jgi:hypothetical protein
MYAQWAGFGSGAFDIGSGFDGRYGGGVPERDGGKNFYYTRRDFEALEAAEAGVEKSLSGVIATGGDDTVIVSGSVPTSDATFNVKQKTDNSPIYESAYRLDSGDVATVDLNSYNRNSLSLCWGKASGSTGAIEVAVYFYRPGPNNFGVGRIGYDGGGRSNGFRASGAGGSCGGAYGRKVTMNFSDLGMLPQDQPKFMRIRFLYDTASEEPEPVAVVGSSNLPPQAVKVTSTGQYGDSVQQLVVTQLNPDLPYMFDAALFSGTGVSQY